MIEALYRALLLLYPAEFRRRFGAEMLDTARALDASRRSRRSRAVIDALHTAVALRAEYRRERRFAFTENRHMPWDALRRDVIFAIRSLRREPAFALFVAATLALATGANAALFGIADRLLVRGPDHVRDAERVRRVYVTAQPPGMGQFTTAGVGHVTYDIVRRASSAEAAATYAINDGTTGRGAEAREIKIGYASASLFSLLGVQPAQGRFFADEEDSTTGARRVAVISDGLWQRQFGRATDVLGRSLIINDDPYDIVGVAPSGFTGAELGRVDVWAPMNLLSARITNDWMRSWSAQWLSVIIRLRQGVDPDAASDELTTLFTRAYDGDEKHMREARVWTAGLGAADDGSEPAESRVVRWLSGVSLLVLLIACANVMNLLLARGARRARELGIRRALGASRLALLRMLVIESTLLSLIGATLGLLVAHVIGGAARNTLLSSIEWSSAPVDARVLLVSLVTATAMGVFVGVVPAIDVTRDALARALRSGVRGGSGRRLRLRAALTVVQSTLSVALLIGAGLFVRSVWNARHVDLGFDPDRVLVVEVSRASLAGLDTSARDTERARRRLFLAGVLDRVRGVPGVEGASVAVGLPFGNRFSVRITVPDLDALPQTGTGGPSISAVEPAYFRTMGTRLLRGRDFNPTDRAGSAPVAIISEFMARTVWPGRDPIGRCVRIGDPPGPCTTIVGVAENTHRARLVEAPKMHVYIPLGQEVGFGGAAMLVRSSQDAESVADAVRSELTTADATITFVATETLAERIDPQMRSWELGTSTLLFSGLLALVVSAVGIYSLLAYLVADRRHEIGVRLALGARVDHVAMIVVRWSIGMSLAGIAAGCLIAAALGTFMQPLLFQVSARDPMVFGSVAGVLLLVALAASLLPSLRAARVDPLEALRAE